jgi:hypothetical protein
MSALCQKRTSGTSANAEFGELPSPRFHNARSANLAAVAGRVSGPGDTHPKLPRERGHADTLGVRQREREGA